MLSGNNYQYEIDINVYIENVCIILCVKHS